MTPASPAGYDPMPTGAPSPSGPGGAVAPTDGKGGDSSSGSPKSSGAGPRGARKGSARLRLPDPKALKAILDAVKAGLPDEAVRLDSAWANVEYYHCRGKQFLRAREGEDPEDFARRPKQTYNLVRQAVRKLSGPLYSPGPTRRFKGNNRGIASWLDAAFAATLVNNVMAEADRRATLNDCAAVQCAATGDADDPIRLHLWDASQYAVWCPPDEPSEPYAVCTRSVMAGTPGKKKVRYQLYTASEVYTYYTADATWPNLTGGTRADRFDPEESGQHGYGRLPFAFIHNEPPIQEFWGGGLGMPLRQTAGEIDRMLSDLAQQIQVFSCPDMFLKNVGAQFRYRKSPGRPQHLPPIGDLAIGEGAPDPDLFFRQPELLIEEVWTHINNLIDLTLEGLEIPLVSVRSRADTDYSSGVALAVRSMPILSYTKARQHKATEDERGVARLMLEVAGNYYGGGWSALADAGRTLDQAYEILWPMPALPAPSPEALALDIQKIQNGIASLPGVVAQYHGVTEQDAYDILKKNARDMKEVKLLFGMDLPPLLQPPPPDFGGMMGEGWDQGAAAPGGKAPANNAPTPDAGGKPAANDSTE